MNRRRDGAVRRKNRTARDRGRGAGAGVAASSYEFEAADDCLAVEASCPVSAVS